MARDAGARAWNRRSGEVSVGLLDTAMVYADALRLVEPDGEELCHVLETACKTLGRLERRRSFGARSILQSLGGRYGTLRDWLIEWHARRTVHAIARGDAAATTHQVECTFKAIGEAKQRTLVAHMDVQDVRPAGASATSLDELRRIAESLPEREESRGDPEDGDMIAPTRRLGAMNSLNRHDDERRTVEELEGRLDALATQVATADADAAAAWGLVPPPTVAEVARSLPPRTTMVLFYPLEHETVVIGVGDWGGAWRAQLAMAPLGRVLLDGFATRIFRRRDGSAVDRPDHTSLDEVLERVAAAFLPAMAQVVPGWASAMAGPDHGDTSEDDDVPTLVLVPTGPLHRLPLHAMPLGPRVSGGADRQRLIDRVVVSYATTADIVPRVSERSAAPSGLAAVAPAAVDREEEAPHRTVAFAQALATLAAPNGYLRIRHDATRDAMTDGTLEGRRYVFVAAHGRAGGVGRTRPTGRMLSGGGEAGDAATASETVRAGILMHGGAPEVADGRWLTARRIVERARFPRVEHVQLLACDTHADDPAPGDELAGLLCAFLVRGGRSVGGTLWKVDEMPAILVGWWLAERLLAGATDKAAALRTATRRLRRATRGEIVQALVAIRQAAAGFPHGADAAAVAAIDANIDIAKSAPPDTVAEAWQLHHWSPYVLHGAPRVR
jgi:CHAT domain-containing protein